MSLLNYKQSRLSLAYPTTQIIVYINSDGQMHAKQTYNSPILQEYYDAWYELMYLMYSKWDATFSRTPFEGNSQVSIRAAVTQSNIEKAEISPDVIDAIKTEAIEDAIARVTAEDGPYKMCWIIASPSPIPNKIRAAKGIGKPPMFVEEDLSHRAVDLQEKQVYLHVYWHDDITFQDAYGLAHHILDTGEMWQSSTIDPAKKKAQVDQLIRELCNQDKSIAEQALETLRASGWLYDKSLEGADLTGFNVPDANLQGAYLYNVKLGNVNLGKADLREAVLCTSALHGINLQEADLRGANLTGADLHGANLTGADLRNSIILEVDLESANLEGANLSDAMLNSCSLRRTNLNNANLSRVDMLGSFLRLVTLQNTNLTEAQCGGTTFAGLDLSTVKGLETILHRAPSHLASDTIFNAQSKLPDVFLRGCGVPDNLILYLPSLFTQAIQFASCFISYSHHNEDFATQLYLRLRDANLQIWYAPKDIQGGKKTHEQIYDAIEYHDRLLLILSDKSIHSEWVKTEIRKARKQELKDGRRKLFPIRLTSFETLRDWECFDADTGKDLAIELREYFIPDFSQWNNKAAFESEVQRLIRDLNTAETDV